MDSFLNQFVAESTFISFSIVMFLILWMKKKLHRDSLVTSIVGGASASNLLVGIVLLLTASTAIDEVYVAKILSDGWVLFWSGALVLGVGIIAIMEIWNQQPKSIELLEVENARLREKIRSSSDS